MHVETFHLTTVVEPNFARPDGWRGFCTCKCKNHDTELPDFSYITARDGVDLLTLTVKKRTVVVITMVGLG